MKNKEQNDLLMEIIKTSVKYGVIIVLAVLVIIKYSS